MDLFSIQVHGSRRLSLGLEVLATYMKAIEAAFNTEMDIRNKIRRFCVDV